LFCGFRFAEPVAKEACFVVFKSKFIFLSFQKGQPVLQALLAIIVELNLKFEFFATSTYDRSSTCLSVFLQCRIFLHPNVFFAISFSLRIAQS